MNKYTFLVSAPERYKLIYKETPRYNLTLKSTSGLTGPKGDRGDDGQDGQDGENGGLTEVEVVEIIRDTVLDGGNF